MLNHRAGGSDSRAWPVHTKVNQLLEAVQSWAVIQQQRVPSFARVGIFGSYGRGTAGFGSDLDLYASNVGLWLSCP